MLSVVKCGYVIGWLVIVFSRLNYIARDYPTPEVCYPGFELFLCRSTHSELSIHTPPFAADSLCCAAGLAKTFPSLTGQFLPDLPGFPISLTVSFHLNLVSSSRALPLHLHFNSAIAMMFSVSSLLFSCPNNSNLLLHRTNAMGSTLASSKISSLLRCSG